MNYFIRDTIFLIIALIILFIIYRKKKTIKDNNFVIEIFSFINLFLLYLQGTPYKEFLKFLIFIGFIVFIWLINFLLMRINKKFVDSKIYLIIISVGSVFSQFIFYTIHGNYKEVFLYNRKEFVYILIFIVIFEFLVKLMLDNRLLCNLFVEKDKTRTVFLISETVFILIFMIESIINILNLNYLNFLY
ncbi:hypothetical protein ABID14_000763 [Peptoniphilus olsenii]|uniref:Uncharacterized protein n=1 Tax=Peptoniphilus olsenii TaxID=411570 RepID=A0ABV2JB85_9FIRM